MFQIVRRAFQIDYGGSSVSDFVRHFNMPKEVKDIKQFLEIARRKDAKSAAVKKSTPRRPGAKTVTKFKVRCSRYLYTLVIADADKAEKLRQSLPPTLKVTDVDKDLKKSKKKSA
ncbi:uncharacterized protein L969DRAFT_43045 [Mixia osmundae IAM 14324]|uniref:Ribosomal protein L38e n=1 Tax=Mixia osmundae (strain CBS 9802 / IAM 14324 / JCM 22182 / KY 12970) TaxID=764103 RepID=G7DZB7_MIXOS|nr:uncharacterized protein L969DRAFT_43045 [Mixia osmundae IAM 14324]KEI42607.1 hypothetical protein L969DRAFT_43045 [Mixia osmundae IAM 14324]GAA95927.1 hypothetical protein E5Q_02585 [Mixia osmundae IAM 14324]